MLKRVLFGLFFLGVIGWVAYVGVDIFYSSNDYSERYLFNSEDGELFVVNRSSEVQQDQAKMTNQAVFQMITTIEDSSYETGYFSVAREHFLLKRKGNWTKAALKSAFADCGEIKNLKDDSFVIGDFIFRYRKTNLYASTKKFSQNEEPIAELTFDQKSSVSVITFDDKSNITLVTDIYVKEGGKVVYATRDDEIEQGNQVHDEAIFAAVLSKKFTSYHFFERDYYSTIDSAFASGPMSQWIQNGFVELQVGGEQVLVSDYIDGQDPILILNDLQQTYDEIKFKSQLTARFPDGGKSYYVKYIEDLVVIAYTEESCDQLIADHKVGNTIALSADTKKRLYADLPRAVSERKVTGESRVSKAVYNGYLLETRFGKSEVQTSTKKESIALTCNFTIKDFAVLPGYGNVVVLGEKGELVYFKDRKEKWRKSIEGKVLSELQLVNLHGSGEGHVLVNTEDEIMLWALNGDAISGFPIKMDNPATNEVKFYRWKGSGYFMIANEEKNVVRYDAKGREITFCKPSIPVSDQVDVWSSQSRLFYGFRSGKSFEMYDVKKNKSHRTFDVAENSHTGRIANELLHFGFTGKKLSRFNQQGTRTDFQTYSRGKIVDVEGNKNNPIVIVHDGTEIHLINQEGVPFGQIHLPFTEVSDVSYSSSNNGKTIVSIIDGLENNVYLYETTGSLLIKRPFEGETKVDVESTGAGLKITTVVGDFVIQYLEN